LVDSEEDNNLFETNLLSSKHSSFNLKLFFGLMAMTFEECVPLLPIS